jgi:hypothetical protein
MKRNELVKKLMEMRCVFIRHGGSHDWYQNPRTKMGNLFPGIMKSMKIWQRVF